ncbi:MAG: polysaccharide deacetylase [Ruminococcaceae bacterium]|nr:polysaccharide deacetylase [Oscillospiraceae bacterium]
MNIAFMRFPEGKPKALTLSYDDGVEQDIDLMKILDKHGIKCTFNINSAVIAREDKVYAPGAPQRRLSKSRVLALYKDSGHEVAVHSSTHPWLETLPTATVAKEIIDDRVALEEMFGTVIRGMAYPMGTFSDEVVAAVKSAGILYARTTISTKSFDIPRDWLRLPTTCRHKDPDLMPLAEKFVNMQVKNHPRLFYLWGHSYEFEDADNWNVIEEFAEYVGGKEDIWYATNIEIFEYVEAFNRLVWSADMRIVKNPSAIPVWVKAGIHGEGEKVIKIEPGETVRL